jgi:hypothetical protein
LKAAREVRAIWIRPFALAILALLVALGVVAVSIITAADRSAETDRLRRQVDAQDTQITSLLTNQGANQAANDCRSRAAALDAEAAGNADEFLRQALVDRFVEGKPLERSGEMLRLNEQAKVARTRRVAASVACTTDPNFIPK